MDICYLRDSIIIRYFKTSTYIVSAVITNHFPYQWFIIILYPCLGDLIVYDILDVLKVFTDTHDTHR